MATGTYMFLPPELVDHTVEYLRDDRAALKACSLLSTQWLECARARLFNTATFERESDLQRWKNLVLSCPDIGLIHLRKINFNAKKGYGWGLEDSRSSEAREDASDGLTCLPDLGTLPRVKSLRLSWPSWSSRQLLQSVETFARSLTSLEELTLSPHFDTPAQASQILSLFPRLRTLRLGADAPDSPSPAASSVAFDTTALETLIMDYASSSLSELVSEFFGRSSLPSCLRSLSVAPQSRYSWPHFAKIINDASSSLETLTFDLFYVTDAESSYINTAVSTIQSLPQLRQITLKLLNIHVDRDASNHRHAASLVAACGLITSLPVIPSMKTLNIKVFHVGVQGSEFLEDISARWGIKEHFPNAQDMNFHVVYGTAGVSGGEIQSLVNDFQSLMEKWNMRSHITLERKREGKASERVLLVVPS